MIDSISGRGSEKGMAKEFLTLSLTWKMWAGLTGDSCLAYVLGRISALSLWV